MFDQIPVRAWILIIVAILAYLPGKYVWRHIAHSPAACDITRPSEDLAWRTHRRLLENLALLGGIASMAIFIFTPAAEKFAQSPAFWPLLIAGLGGWSLSTALRGLATGRIQPFISGFNDTFERSIQTKRFWGSLAWNATLGGLCLFFGFTGLVDAPLQGLRDRCFDFRDTRSPRDNLAACSGLLAKSDPTGRERAEYLGARGLASYQLRDDRAAVADLSEAIRFDADNATALYNRGLAYQRLGNQDRAVADFTAAIRIEPTDSEAYFTRGLIALETGKFDEAIADFGRVHELDADDPWPIANRGVAYAWKNDRDRAEQDFAAVRAMDGDNPVMLRGEALLAFQAGEMKEAVTRFTAALAREPGSAWTLRMRARAYGHLGEYEKGRADMEKADQLGRPN